MTFIKAEVRNRGFKLREHVPFRLAPVSVAEVKCIFGSMGLA